MQPDIGYYRINFQFTDLLFELEPNHYALGIFGEIVHIDDSPAVHGEPESAKVGYTSAYYLPAYDAIEGGVSVFEMYDATSSELEECYAALFDGNELKEDVVDGQFDGDVMTKDVLYLARIEILPAHRGRNLGLAVTRRMIERFGPATGLVAMIPFPLRSSQLQQSAEEMEMDEFDQDHERSQKKLENYYSRLGFERVGDTRVFALTTAYRIPSLGDISPALQGGN
jgi:GNAT superfamily N-acetyltransferase